MSTRTFLGRPTGRIREWIKQKLNSRKTFVMYVDGSEWSGVVKNTSEIPGKTNVKTVVFGSTIQNIDQDAFSNCTNLTGVVIPDSVVDIGKKAFYKCGKLENVSLGQGVTRIQESAFQNCRKLAGVVIPDSVTTIDKNAFMECVSMTSVRIGRGLQSVSESNVFAQCTQLTSFIVDEDNQNFKSVNNMLLSKDGKRLFAGVSTRDVIVPEGVDTIGSGAFSRYSVVRTVSIPEGVKNIEHGAFYNCYNLTALVLPSTVVAIGQLAFFGCESMTSASLGESLETIEENAFQSCEGLTQVTIPDTCQMIGDGAFSGCVNVQRMVMPSIEQVSTNAFYFEGDEMTVNFVNQTSMEIQNMFNHGCFGEYWGPVEIQCSDGQTLHCTYNYDENQWYFT